MSDLGKMENFLGGLNLLASPSQIQPTQCQIIENMEVRPTSLSDNLTYLALTARSSYKRLHTGSFGFTPKCLVEFIQRGNTVGATTTVVAAGLNDATFGGTYTGSTIYSTYEVEIETVAASPDTFRWRKDGGSYTTGVGMTGSAQTLAEGVTITFGAINGHTIGDKWTTRVSPNNTKFLVTGGQNASNTEMRFLADGATTTNQFSLQTTTTVEHITVVPFGSKLYYTDGTRIWRSWTGTTDAQSAFTTITKYACKHKSRMIYANDVTNGAPHYVWVSDVGLPETVGASNFFAIGDASDPIIAVMDQIERVLIIKENSVWALYLAPTLSSSTLLRADEYKGSVSPRGLLFDKGQTMLYTTDAGIQISQGLQFQSLVPQIQNFLKGFQNSLASLGFWEDYLLIATKSVTADTYNKRVFLYHTESKNVYQYNINLSLFCQNRGIMTFNKKLKAIEDDGTNRYIIEFDQTSSTVESTVTCVARTKEFDLGTMTKQKKIRALHLVAIFPDTTTALTIKSYGDGTLKETKTFTPTATGEQVVYIKFNPETTRGREISFRFEYAQDTTLSLRLALLEINKIEGDLEARDE